MANKQIDQQIVIHRWMTNMTIPGTKGKYLRGTKLLLYAIIYSYTVAGKEYYGGQNALERDWKINQGNASTYLKELTEWGLIQKKSSKYRDYQSDSYTAVIPDFVKNKMKEKAEKKKEYF